ncbi:MAG: carboxylesterase family protein, partial [Clostridiales Family XIII bacterium]|nr:carboxylesterase family protein [Clostridiales Family XIII bacterium]
YTADDSTRFIPGDTDEAGYRRLLERLFGAAAAEQVAGRFPVQTGTSAAVQARRVFTAACFVVGALRYADAFRETGGKVYLYRYSRVEPADAAQGLGARHGVELRYVFDSFGAYNKKPTAAQRALCDAMHGAWVRFIKQGDPNGAGAGADDTAAPSGYPLPIWHLYEKDSRLAMDFGETAAAQTPAETEDADFLGAFPLG